MTMVDFPELSNLGSIFDSEGTCDGKTLTIPQADRVDIGEDGKEETSQTSDEVEWDDTLLEEQIQAVPIKNIAKTSGQTIPHAHLTLSKEEDMAMLRKDNRTNTNQSKAQCQQVARKKLQPEKQARLNKSRNFDQPSTDSDTELSAESVATIHQSNTRLGDNPTNKPWTLQQATEGVSLPVFRGTLPRKYLY